MLQVVYPGFGAHNWSTGASRNQRAVRGPNFIYIELDEFWGGGRGDAGT